MPDDDTWYKIECISDPINWVFVALLAIVTAAGVFVYVHHTKKKKESSTFQVATPN